jgi:intracellular multiplication protein IcmV
MFHGAVAGTLLVLAVIALSAVRAFQYSFWNFHIKNRKLGCSFSDWWKKI